MQVAANELSGPYFSLSSMFSKQDNKTSVSNSEERFWSASFDSNNINVKSPVSSSKYDAGEIFSSSLVKNENKSLGNQFWGLVSFNKARVNDQTSVPSLKIDNIEEWVSIPFGGFFAAYNEIK